MPEQLASGTGTEVADRRARYPIHFTADRAREAPRRLAHVAAEGGAECARRAVTDALGDLGDPPAAGTGDRKQAEASVPSLYRKSRGRAPVGIEAGARGF